MRWMPASGEGCNDRCVGAQAQIFNWEAQSAPLRSVCPALLLSMNDGNPATPTCPQCIHSERTQIMIVYINPSPRRQNASNLSLHIFRTPYRTPLLPLPLTYLYIPMAQSSIHSIASTAMWHICFTSSKPISCMVRYHNKQQYTDDNVAS